MAEGGQEKTEAPTADRLRKARGEGRIPQSQEFASALAIGAVLLTAFMTASDLWTWFTYQITQGLSGRADGGLTLQAVMYLLTSKSAEAVRISAPFLVSASVASVFSGLFVSGWAFSPKAVRFRWSRLNPAAGMRSLISPRSGVNMLVSCVKCAAVLAIVWNYMRDQWSTCLALMWASPVGSMAAIFGLLFGVVVRITIAMGLIGLADALYQKWQYRRDLRMTRHEVKEERKQQELPMLVRRRIVQTQFEMVRRRMLQEVPKADVVLTNPTHVAVALKYEASSMQAPQVVAKGADRLSEKIKEIARAYGVPIVERPELARALFSTVEIGQIIPEALYIAVAEVLAMIYRLRRRR